MNVTMRVSHSQVDNTRICFLGCIAEAMQLSGSDLGCLRKVAARYILGSEGWKLRPPSEPNIMYLQWHRMSLTITDDTTISMIRETCAGGQRCNSFGMMVLLRFLPVVGVGPGVFLA